MVNEVRDYIYHNKHNNISEVHYMHLRRCFFIPIFKILRKENTINERLEEILQIKEVIRSLLANEKIKI